MAASITESAMIRSKLAVRFNTNFGCWEVYTTIHGSGGVFRWYKISEATANWYCQRFQLVPMQSLEADRNTGALNWHAPTVTDNVNW